MKSADIEKEIARLTKHYSNTKNPVNFPQSNTFDDLMYRAGLTAQGCWDKLDDYDHQAILKFAQLIVQECIDKIETYRITRGNSASGELACEWTYAALKEIRDDIKETFGVN